MLGRWIGGAGGAESYVGEGVGGGGDGVVGLRSQFATSKKLQEFYLLMVIKEAKDG